jgi:glucoamylase
MSMLRSILLSLLLTSITLAQALAPGGPGHDAQWATAGKQGVGTSASLQSKVWFTLAQGVMTEVYYPDVTVANVHLLQFCVRDSKTGQVWTEKDDAVHEINVLRTDSLSFQQINTAKKQQWKIIKTYATDSKNDSVLIDVQFRPFRKGLDLYAHFDPSLANSGMHDTATRYGSYLTAFDGNIASALLFSLSDVGVTLTSEESNGFFGEGVVLRTGSERAENGNVIQTVKRVLPKNRFTVVLSFGPDERSAVAKAVTSLTKGFLRCQAEYDSEWADYIRTIPKVDPKYQPQFNMAAMQLKAHEDKTHRGANIASLTVPWGGGANANENNVGGYHLVWSRDLYQVATAFIALGDKAAANRALDFLFNVQQRPDGSFPQNSWLDGKPFWGSLQMDEVAYPLILAYQLGRFDRATYDRVRRAADFIVKNGPLTPQERWEEESGYSPSTIAAEIAGLVCAAEIAKRNGDQESAERWLTTADEWNANIEKWTATTTGRYGDGNYYLRITQNGKPDAGDQIEINNGSGFFDERDIVDAGFLELVRLGIRSADDPLIVKSLNVIDQVIKVDTPNGAAFYRYNHDGYGEMDDGRRWNWDGKYTGKGRLWALLSGERGQYEIALANFKSQISNSKVANKKGGGSEFGKARSRLDAMAGFANEGLMIPEQVWDTKVLPTVDPQFIPDLEYGEGTGSATPLAWSMAQFIRLATNLKSGRNLDTPNVVYERYVLRPATR